MTDWSKYKIQDDTPKKSKWDQYKIEEPSKKKEDSESTSTLPVSESKEQLSTPVVSHSGFRTVREKGTAQTPGIAIEKTPTDVIVFDEQKEIEEFEKQRELSQLNVKEKYATIKPQLDELKQTLTKQKDETDAAFNYARTTLEELKRAGQLDNTAPDVAELSNSYSTLYKQTQDNDKALRNIKDAELFVEDLEKVISGKNKKFSEGASQTFLKKIAFDGIAEIKRNYNLKNISGKLANNEDITEDERLAISTYGLLNEAQANFPSGIGYDVGRGLVEMVPYLASFAASGGASKVIQQGLMQAMKSTGAKTTQEMLKKGLAYVSGQAVRPAFFTSLYSQGLEKQIGQVDTDQEGKPTIAEGTKEKPIKAFTKAYANTLSEVMTEQLGEVAAPLVNRIVGKEVKQVLNPSIITKVKDAVAFNGFVLEMGEYFANKAANVAIEGQPATEIFNPREILTTAMTVGVMSGGFMVANAPYKRSVSAKVQETGASLDTKTRKQVDNIVESSKPVEDKAKELSYIVDEKVKSNAPESEVSNVVQYATASNAERTAKNVEDVVPVIEKNKNNMSGEQAQQTREKVESELKDKYGNERGAELLSMFDFFTEKYVYTPEEFSALNKGKKKPSEPLEPKSDITPPLEVENAPTIETIPVDAKNIIDQHKDFIENSLTSRKELLNLQQNEQRGTKTVLDKPDDTRNQGRQVGRPELLGANIPTTPPSKPRYNVGGSDRYVGDSPVKTFSLSDQEASDVLSNNPKAVIDNSFSEVSDATSFYNAISESKKGNKYAASVFVYPEADYKKYRKFLTDDGLAGAAIDNNGTIISVFSHGAGKGRAPQIILQAIKEGGVKLDHYDTELTEYYHRFGFVPVAKVKWNDQYAPQDWDKETFKRYNNGEPDVVLMAYDGGDPNTLSQRYGKFGGVKAALDNAPYVASFEEGQVLQDEYVKRVQSKTTEEPTNAEEIRTTPQETGGQEELVAGEEGRIRVRDDEESRVEAQEGVAEEVPKETVGSLLEKEEQSKKEESGFLPFVLPLSIFQSPRAKRKAVDIKQVLKEQFLPSRGMPPSIYKEFVKAKGKVNARKFDIQRSFKQMTKDLYDAYGAKITLEQKESINTALENLGPSRASRDIAFNTISKSVPVEARGIVERMRNDIDAYTEDLKKLDMIGVGLEGKMDANTGYYVTRTYKKHTDRDWTWEKIPLKIKEDAANKLMEVFGIEADEALGMAKEMLETPDLTDYIIRKGNSLADIDKRSLNKRSVFLTDNPEIRKLLGENRDPLYNYAMSMTRMAEMIEKGKMLENIRDIGLAEGILSEKPSFEKNHVAQIKYNKGLFAGKPGTKQLADYYTTPEIAKSINSFMDTSSPSGAMMRAYMKLITTSKIAKTALSIKGLVRNFQSNIVNALANGNWDLPQIATRLKQLASNKDTWAQFTRELYEQNIIGDSANAGELIRNVEDLSNRISTIEKSDETLGEKGKRVVIDNALKLYGFADDVWKVYRYISEKGKYQFAFEKKGYSPQEAEQLAKQRATEILHKTSTYYSELPPIIQNMRKLPFTNTFVSFPYLTTVNFIGTVETAVQEMKDPATMFIGLQRMGGAVMSLAALAALSEFRNKGEGQDEKDMEAWRRFLPDFWKNDLITITKDNGNGTAEYNNTSYLDYYNAITSPMMLLRRRLIANGEITTDDIIESAEEFSKSFLGWDIIFNKLTQVKANEDELGRQIFNPQDEKQEIYKDILGHIWEGVEPGTITDARRIYKSYREGGEWQKQMIGTLTGRQTRSIDPLKSLDFYMLPKYKDQFNNARSIYKNQLKQYNRLKE
ncbi:MAG: hypothetical protein GYA36_21915, partial [Veillonellaceae bacterium]|nr:hypothetical protein [Veillonellaceae bacterium]